MELHKKWKELVDLKRSKEENDAFWKGYILKETSVYEIILENKRDIVTGSVSEISKEFDMELEFLVGFIDGINTSLKSEIDLENLSENTEINMEIDFEKLYYNMLKAKADWLYNLEQWDDILTKGERSKIKKEYSISQMVVSNKVGRNEDCPCGSGKKYKKCCLNS